MNEVWNDPLLQDFIHQFLAGEVTILTGSVWLAIAAGLSIAGGAIGGILLAKDDLGTQLSAMIGGLFGPAGMIPAALLGLLFIGTGMIH